MVKTFRAEKEIFRLFAENSRALEDEKFSRRRHGRSSPSSRRRWKRIRRRRAPFSCPGCRTAYGGRILLDGTELREAAPESVYELISVIQQNVFVFNASIVENISMFRQFPQAELEDAIRHAHLGELLARRGQDSLCGENGCNLSGGEKQRVSIAGCT